MAVGIFRKISDKLHTIWNSLKEYAPLFANIGRAVAPVVSAVNPAIGSAIGIGSNALGGLVDGFSGDMSGANDSSKILNDDVSPFIKFKRSI